MLLISAAFAEAFVSRFFEMVARPFPNSLLPLSQIESLSKRFLLTENEFDLHEMNLHTKHFSTTMVLHEDSFWHTVKG